MLLQSELDAIIANPAGFYANVHNTPFPAGALLHFLWEGLAHMESA